MSDDLFSRVNKELERRLDLARRFPPGTRGAETEKATFLGISLQRWHNWSMRKTGIPPKEYKRIADRLRWTTDQLHGKKSAPGVVVALPREPLLTPDRRSKLKYLLKGLKDIPGEHEHFFREWDLFIEYFEKRLAGLKAEAKKPASARRAGPEVPRQRPAK